MVNKLKLLIKSNLKTFISIMLLTMLGVGFLVGMNCSVPNLKYTVDNYFDNYNIFDLQLTSSIGFNTEDIEEFKKITGIKKIEGSYQKDLVVKNDKGDYVLRIQSYINDPNTINQFELLEGTLPINKNEIVIEKSLYKKRGYKLGDKIILNNKMLDEKELTIVGVIKSPLYLSSNKGTTNLLSGVVNHYGYINIENINSDLFSHIYIKLTPTANIDTVINKLRETGTTLLDVRYADTIKEYQEKITIGEQELAQKKNETTTKLKQYEMEIANAELQINSAEKSIPTINEAKIILNNKKNELNKIKSELEIAKVQINNAKNQYNTANNEYQEIIKQINNLSNNLEKTQNVINKENSKLEQEINNLEQKKLTASEERKIELEQEIATKRNQIKSNNDGITTIKNYLELVKTSFDYQKQKLNEANEELINKQQEYDITYNEYQKALKIVESNSAEEIIAIAKKEIASQKKKLTAKKKELENQKKSIYAELEKYQNQLDDAKDYLKYISISNWNINTRTEISSYNQYLSDIKRIENIGNFFPIIFYVVAVLITLTNISRIIEKDRDTIGLYKALGYQNFDIGKNYIMFSVISCLFGAILGTLLGLYIIPKIFYNVYKIIYYLPKYQYLIDYKIILIAIFIALILVVISAYSSIKETIKERPAILLRPKETTKGKRLIFEKIPFIWKYLNFTNKVTIRNMFKHPKRFIMTILGISGCASLIIAGFNIKTSISNIIPLQFGHIFDIDVEIFLKDSLSRTDIYRENNRIKELSNIDSTILSYVKYVYLNDTESKVNLVVPEDNDLLLDFVRLEHKNNKYELTDDGGIITKKIAELLKIKVGDIVKIKDSDNNIFNIKINAIVNNYVDNYLYISKNYYYKLLNTYPKYNAILARTKSNDFNKTNLTEELNLADNISYLVYTSTSQKMYNTITQSLNYIVYILVISAVMLAFIVLYNLNTLNIEERKREIATIKVLGFTKKETYQYIENEVNRLAIIGIILGVFLGYIFSNILIKSCELDNLMYDYSINYLNYLYAIIITIIFMIITSLVGRKNIKKINMIESLKKVE